MYSVLNFNPIMVRMNLPTTPLFMLNLRGYIKEKMATQDAAFYL